MLKPAAAGRAHPLRLRIRIAARLGSPRLDSTRLGSTRLGSARLGSARLGSDRIAERLNA